MRLTGNESIVYILKEVGARIKDARIAYPMTRDQLSEKSGVSLSTIVRIESGTGVGFEQVLHVLKALNMLHTIDIMIPEYVLSPVDNANGKTKRKRASSAKHKSKSTTPWEWGDN